MRTTPIERVNLIVYDGVGCGESADAKYKYPEDAGANSLVNASRIVPIDAPTIQAMGLEHLPGCKDLVVAHQIEEVRGAYGALAPTFQGKGSPEGHMALCGYTRFEPYLYFNKTGFPPELVALVEEVAAEVIGRQVKTVRYPGTDSISGTEFIKHDDIWKPHLASTDTSKPFVLPIYASADSLIQVAYHQKVLSQETAEALGRALRKALNERGWRIGRIILRPFGGEPGSFKRVGSDRRDYAVDPDEPTLIDYLTEAGVPVSSIGKFGDMLNSKGYPPGSCEKLHDDDERIGKVIQQMKDGPRSGLVTTNLVRWDEDFGHRRNPRGYVEQLNAMDLQLAKVVANMRDNDLLMIASDHGNDPTNSHTDHTRENTILLALRNGMSGPMSLGVRATYADVAATIGAVFGVKDKLPEGESFLSELMLA
jgi:phosphopentomutase